MTGYDFNRPYIGYEAFQTFKAIAPEVAAQYGETVIATELSNSEYNARYAKFAKKNNMKPPIGAGQHKFAYESSLAGRDLRHSFKDLHKLYNAAQKLKLQVEKNARDIRITQINLDS